MDREVGDYDICPHCLIMPRTGVYDKINGKFKKIRIVCDCGWSKDYNRTDS
jgi:hypothetical protein